VHRWNGLRRVGRGSSGGRDHHRRRCWVHHRSWRRVLLHLRRRGCW
jgi:hypothetical protein